MCTNFSDYYNTVYFIIIIIIIIIIINTIKWLDMSHMSIGVSWSLNILTVENIYNFVRCRNYTVIGQN